MMQKVVLVVEDESEIRKDILMTLQLSNYEAVGAEDGIEALKLAQEIKPDLIISDIMMPHLDGYGLLAEIQKIPDIATIPFLFLSAKSDIREGMNLGADDFITKPYDIEELLDAIETRLKKQEVSETKYLKKFEELSTRISQSLPHEIRTPLGMILGYSDFLLKNFDNSDRKEIKEMLENINESGKRLNHLFENHLYYANLETIAANENELLKLKEDKTQHIDVILSDIINYIVSNAGRRVDTKVRLASGTVNISQKYLMKLSEEILDNAMKFSDEGSPILVYSEIDEEMYVITFEDHGRGMTKDQIKNVGAYIQFERQLYEQQGSGLGFAIVKKITGLHNGEFNIESEKNNLTKVTIKLPLEKN